MARAAGAGPVAARCAVAVEASCRNPTTATGRAALDRYTTVLRQFLDSAAPN